jgi:hypothetical protein
MQVLVRNQPADLSPLATRLRRQAVTLAHPKLEQAALAHASWLEQLGGHHQARRRDLLVIFRHPSSRRATAAAALARQAEQATGLLAATASTLTVLDAEAAGRVLAAATGPASPPRPPGLAPPAAIITGAHR